MIWSSKLRSDCSGSPVFFWDADGASGAGIRPAAVRVLVMALALAVCLLSSFSYARALPDFTELVEENTPAVVIISTVQKARAGRHAPRQPYPDYFRYFFGDQFQVPDQERESLGSGIIISRDGYILTNNHVVEGADEINIRFSDRRVMDAKLIGGDALSDLALLKVDARDLPVAKLGKSEKLKIGEWVLAIGTPFGFEHSVTSGIVSAKNRNLSNDHYVPFIQTDVAINPGNSGGPLFNMQGEVVGINSQIYSRTGGFMGLSFAIPIDVAMEVVEQLKESGQVARGWLGVIIQDVSRDLAISLGLDKPAGALIARVMESSPAAAGGIRPGDVILKLDGKDVLTTAGLRHLVGRTKPNSDVTLTISRAGKRQKLTLTIGELPQDPTQVAKQAPQATQRTKLGMSVGPLNAAQQRQLGVPGGVLVREVEGQNAQEAGIRPGDVILNLANEEINSVADFERVQSALDSGSLVPILVYRRGAPEFLALRVE